MADPDQRFDTVADPGRERVRIASSLGGLALVLGAIASFETPAGDQALQDLVFGMVLGAVFSATALSSRAFDFRVVAPGFGLLLIVTTALWFAGLKPQFAFASTTAFVLGQGVAAGLAIVLRAADWRIGASCAALAGLAVQWTLFAYADPRIVKLTGIQGWGNDRLMGSATTTMAAMVTAAIAVWWLTRPDARPVTSP